MPFGFKARLPHLNRRSNFGTQTRSKGWRSGPAQARQIERRRCLLRVKTHGQSAECRPTREDLKRSSEAGIHQPCVALQRFST